MHYDIVLVLNKHCVYKGAQLVRELRQGEKSPRCETFGALASSSLCPGLALRHTDTSHLWGTGEQQSLSRFSS